jgi:hypothetical protein
MQATNRDDQRIAAGRAINSQAFDWKIFIVAASGFFTDSYNIFAANLVLPAAAIAFTTCSNPLGYCILLLFPLLKHFNITMPPQKTAIMICLGYSIGSMAL